MGVAWGGTAFERWLWATLSTFLFCVLSADVAGAAAPTLGGAPADATVLEDTTTPIELSAYTIADADGDPITLTLAVDRGSVATTDGDGTTDGVVISNSGTGAMTLQGTATALNTYLDDATKVTFRTAFNDITTAVLTVTPNDGVTDGTADTISISVTNVNDAPSLTATGGNPTFAEGGGTQDLFNTVVASTGEFTDRFTTLTLTVTNISDGANEVLSFDGSDLSLSDGTALTTATNGLSVSVVVVGTTATVSFTGASISGAQMATLIDALTYRNTSENPTVLGNRVVTITQLKDDGGTANGGVDTLVPNLLSVVTVTAQDDAPRITLPSSPTMLRNSVANAISDDLNINDVDALLDQITLTATNGTIAISGSGLTYTVDTGTVKTFSGALADVNAALDSLTFTPDTNFAGTASIEVTASTLPSSETLTITVTGVGFADVTVDIPDLTGANAGDVWVSEDATRSGTFTLNNPGLLSSGATALSVLANATRTNLTLVEVTALGTSHKAITGVEGTLTLNGFNGSSGQVSWTYDPTGISRDHTNSELLQDVFTFTAIDVDGEADTAPLDIRVFDTAPTAAQDTKTITLGGLIPYVTGDVTTNDTTGADTAIFVSEASHDGTVFMTASWSYNVPYSRTGCLWPSPAATFTYGTGCIYPDGTYTYQPDQTNPHLLALKQGQWNIEQLDYIISDQDGDTSPATLSIWIYGGNDAPEITLPSTAPTLIKDTTDNALSDDLQITDVDGDDQTVTLTATNGTFSLAANGATLSGTGANVASETVVGTLAQVNAVLDSLTFTPTPAFTGTATLRIETADIDIADLRTLSISVIEQDITPPVVTAIAPSGSPAANATTVSFSVDFDEGAENISTDDFELTTTGTATGTISAVSASAGNPISVTVNAVSGEGTLRLDLKGSTDIADADANSPPAAFTSGGAHTVDTIAPVLAEVTAVPNPSNATYPEVTFSSSEAGTISAVGGACANHSSATVVAGNNTIALAAAGSLASLANGIYSNCTVTVSDGVNASAPLNLSSFTIDRAAPTATLSGAPATISSGGTFDVTLTFSKSVGPLDTSDFSVTNATTDSVSAGTGTTFTASFTADGAGDVSISYQAMQTQDAAGNDNLASNAITVGLDTALPTASIGALTGPVNGKYEAIITLSEASTDFTVDDLDLVNAEAVLSGSGTNYIATLTPLGDGPISVAVAAGSFSDPAGNSNGSGSSTVSVTHDGTRPNVTLAGAPVAVRAGQSFDITITFDETVTGFVQADLDLTNATATLSGSGPVFTAQISPDGNGDVSISVPENVALDAASNGNTASNTLSVTYDDVAPTAQIAALVGPSGGTYTTTITLSEASTDFALEDLELVNASAQITGSGDSYAVTLSPLSDGDVSITVKSGSFSDAVGNFNAVASNTQTAIYDTIAPTVTLSGGPGVVGYMDRFTITVTFAEDVVAFTPSDITAVNATVESVSGTGPVYQAQLTALGSGDVSVQVQAGATQDAAGNPNAASNVIVIASDVRQQTQEKIAQFQLNRANALLANQPDLQGFARGGGQRGAFNASVTRARGDIDFAKGPTGTYWAQLKASKSFVDARNGDYLFAAIGSHRAIGENVYGGVMLQFDHLDERNSANRTAGTGWLVGTYVFGKFPTQPVYFSASILGGKTRNETSPFGTYTDRFDSTRFLITGDLSGEWVATQKLRLFPTLSASYLTDTQQAYTDGLSNLIPQQRIALAQIGLGLDFSYTVETSSGQFELNGGLTGVFSDASGTGAAAIVNSTTEPRARATLGIVYTTDAQTRIEVNSYLDGIGQSDFESYGIDFNIQLLF